MNNASIQYNTSTGGTPLNDNVPVTATATLIPNTTYNGTDSPPAVGHGSQMNSPAVANSRYIFMGSRLPVVMTYCPRCSKQQSATTVHTKATGTTWGCVLAGVLIFWPLCWVPLVVKEFKQTNHYCSGCGAKVGRVKPFGG